MHQIRTTYEIFILFWKWFNDGKALFSLIINLKKYCLFYLPGIPVHNNTKVMSCFSCTTVCRPIYTITWHSLQPVVTFANRDCQICGVALDMSSHYSEALFPSHYVRGTDVTRSCAAYNIGSCLASCHCIVYFVIELWSSFHSNNTIVISADSNEIFSTHFCSLHVFFLSELNVLLVKAQF